MACECNKCNPTKNCGCADSPLNTPCSYTDCSVGSERCEDIQCAECVSYCGTSFQIGSSGLLIKIESGDRLDSIIQKLALLLSQGLGACTSDDLHHAPYNFYATLVTSTTLSLVWNGESSLTTGINVYVDNAVTPTGWTLVNITPIAPTVLTYDVTLLTPATPYKFKLESTDAGMAACDSVEILITTLT